MPSSETTSVEDFYPRPPRGGRLKVQRPRRRNRAISIHALREEGDLLWGDTVHRPNQFLSTPSARRATGFDNQSVMNKLFLSTPSARRATCATSSWS